MKNFKITLTQHSPACFAGSRHKQNIYYTQDYIPGSVLWGAFIKIALQSQGEELHPDFFNHNLRFSNCYIKKRHGDANNTEVFPTLPVPLSLYTCKTNPYSFQDGQNSGHDLVDLLFQDKDNCTKPNCKSSLRTLNPGYIYETGSGKLGLYHPNKMVEMHNQIDKDTQNTKENSLFAYELLDEPGTIFSGEIQVLETSPLLKFIRSIESGEISIESLQLGKARTSGCGHFTFKISETAASLQSRLFTSNFHDTVNLYCFSDVIVMDRFNRYQTVITPEILGLEEYLEMKAAFSRGFIVEGYNAKHNMRKINDTAILKGSCFSYRVKESALKKGPGLDFIIQRLKDIEMNGLGLRLNEGFGRVLFNRIELKEEINETILKNNKYQAPVNSKENYLKEINKAWPMLTDIKFLPSYSALKSVFKEIHLLDAANLAKRKENFISLIRSKTEKRRKHLWQYKDFADTLVKRIQTFNNPVELRQWLECFLENYRLLKSENKDE
ncbi:MAG: hypothetical protein MUF15_03225 [Acidobacteria bacterium]|jgi:CRISPR-associated protein Csx10|nr:hypothetical protein [Acidobacteriota bacterium]